MGWFANGWFIFKIWHFGVMEHSKVEPLPYPRESQGHKPSDHKKVKFTKPIPYTPKVSGTYWHTFFLFLLPCDRSVLVLLSLHATLGALMRSRRQRERCYRIVRCPPTSGFACMSALIRSSVLNYVTHCSVATLSPHLLRTPGHQSRLCLRFRAAFVHPCA